jgi:Alpha-acetolactate decarboxylase
MPDLMVKIPRSISNALVDRAAKSGASIETIVNLALSEHLNTPLHTLFQVSTSGALVAGVYDKQVSVQTILEHGDFGLGTFAHLDGEMVVLDGHAYQVRGTGAVAEASPDAWAPFAVVTRFSPEINVTLGPVFSFLELQRLCDSHRKSGNLFYALRVDGAFARIRTRGQSGGAGSAPARCGEGPERVQFREYLGDARWALVARVFKRVQRGGIPPALPIERSPPRWPRAGFGGRAAAATIGDFERLPSGPARVAKLLASRPQQEHG